MSDAFWVALIGASIPSTMVIISNVVTHILAGRARKAAKEETVKKMDETKKETDVKLNHIAELSNSMLSHTTEKKEEAEKKLEQTKADQLIVANTKNAELEKQIALLTNAAPTPKPENPGGTP